jgi:hypothetical protein
MLCIEQSQDHVAFGSRCVAFARRDWVVQSVCSLGLEPAVSRVLPPPNINIAKPTHWSNAVCIHTWFNPSILDDWTHRNPHRPLRQISLLEIVSVVEARPHWRRLARAHLTSPQRSRLARCLGDVRIVHSILTTPESSSGRHATTTAPVIINSPQSFF